MEEDKVPPDMGASINLSVAVENETGFQIWKYILFVQERGRKSEYFKFKFSLIHLEKASV